MIEKNPVKVVLDSDVIIHFIKGGCLNLLPTILPTYSFIILDIVFQKELANSHKTIIENTVHFLKSITIEKWEITSKEEKEEFIALQKKRGLGESASIMERKKYLLNAYRVLPTRARQGMVIVIPEGNEEDHTRKKEYYDGTYNYLKNIGLQTI